MSKTDSMFEELGYRIYHENNETLIYKKKSDFFEISITFDKRDFKKCFYAVEGEWVAKNSAVWVTQEFKNEFDKYSSANGYWSSIWHEYNMQELQAINEKCKELRMDIEKCKHENIRLVEFYIKGVANRKNYFVKCEQCMQRTRNRNTPLKVITEFQEHEGSLYEFYRK